jgi:hypothetical protein
VLEIVSKKDTKILTSQGFFFPNFKVMQRASPTGYEQDELQLLGTTVQSNFLSPTNLCPKYVKKPEDGR